MVGQYRVIFVAGALTVLGIACIPATPSTQNNNTGDCQEGTTRCDTGNTVEVCREGQWQVQEDCALSDRTCNNGTCTVCQPERNYCQGNDVYKCNSSGTAGDLVGRCDEEAGQTCYLGFCMSLCEQAISNKSYIGCEYWPTVTANPGLDGAFQNDFAVVVHNANPSQVTITVYKGGNQVAQQEVAAESIETITLPYVSGLKQAFPGPYRSTIEPSGSYRLVSTAPVTVYQFNPLNYQLNTTCQFPFPSPPCFSHTNDASLLLPSHVLSMHYMIMSRSTFGASNPDSGGWVFFPGFAAVTATQDDTVVTVHFTAHTTAGSGQVGTYGPGDSAQFQLAKGDVLQILSASPGSCTGEVGQYGAESFCDQLDDYDLTGTVIESTAPVAVYSGHSCANVPFNYPACDHLEEQVFPSETWGKEFVVTRTEPQSPEEAEPNLYRILSREDGNQVTFHPVSVQGAVTLNKGEYIEFLTHENFHVLATQPILVGQFTVGQNYYAEMDYWGDPAFALVAPFEQYRTSYTFLVPDSITYNYVNIVAEVGEAGQDVAAIVLDGRPVSFVGAQRIGESNYGVMRVDLSSVPDPHHTITGDRPFGIMVYGFANYTSFFYPGGLNLEYINPVR